jgi:hypothetical protein
MDRLCTFLFARHPFATVAACMLFAAAYQGSVGL